MKTKAPNDIDRHVGSRVRMRRMLIGMSQEKLGDSLGLTFQQVQKYEKGTNRISASRLQQIAGVLGVSIDYLYGGGPERPEGGFAEGQTTAYEADLMNTESIRLLRSFRDIKDRAVRRRIVELVTTLASPTSDEQDARSS